MKANRYAAAILAITAVAFGSQAAAETPNAVPEQAFTSGKSCAEVGAELARYKRQGVNPRSTSHTSCAALPARPTVPT